MQLISIDFWAKNSLFNMLKMVHWLWIFDILGDRVVKGDEILSDTDHYSRHLHSSHQLAKVPKSGSNWSGGLSKTRNLPLFCPHWYWSHKLLSLDWIVSTLWDLKKYLHHNYDEDDLDDDYYDIYYAEVSVCVSVMKNHHFPLPSWAKWAAR